MNYYNKLYSFNTDKCSVHAFHALNSINYSVCKRIGNDSYFNVKNIYDDLLKE